MILQPIDYVVYLWLGMAVLSAAYVAYDQFRNNPEATVISCRMPPTLIVSGNLAAILHTHDAALRERVRHALAHPAHTGG